MVTYVYVLLFTEKNKLAKLKDFRWVIAIFGAAGSANEMLLGTSASRAAPKL